MNPHFHTADILLPDFSKTDGTLWAVVACDQYTSEPEYWQAVEQRIGPAPSTLGLILPEVYLSEADARIPKICTAMETAIKQTLLSHPGAMLCLARTQADGRVRRGLIGTVDLEEYDYRAGAASLIRATEGTVLERIPPRVAVRRGAALELPHVMLLIDDRGKSVIEPVFGAVEGRTPIYDFDLMQNGGHVRAHLLSNAEVKAVQDTLNALITPDAMEARYGDAALSPLLFAVGDGNHSLATAKAAYEELKASIGADAAREHPARYALCEVVNLHDEALEFEPIYRVVFGADVPSLLKELKLCLQSQNGRAAPQVLTAVSADGEAALTVPHPQSQLAVGTLQAFLTDYTSRHPEVTVDYIHGEESLRALAKQPHAVGFLFEGMQKDELFRTVLYDGALPRKTFSMGHAHDKRFYIEARRIK